MQMHVSASLIGKTMLHMEAIVMLIVPQGELRPTINCPLMSAQDLLASDSMKPVDSKTHWTVAVELDWHQASTGLMHGRHQTQ